MSHFVGLCFGNYWEFNLEEYDEALEVEEYVVYTKEEAIKEVETDQLQRYTYAIKKLQEDSLSKEDFDYYTKVVSNGPSISHQEAWEIVQDWGYTIDKDDNLVSTYNPYAKWDWYCIGGRWSGFLVIKERDENGDIIKVDSALNHEIDWEYMFDNNLTPFCYVTEEGEWQERGSMGWWGCVSNEKESDIWTKQFKDYLKIIDSDCLVTVVDFHI